MDMSNNGLDLTKVSEGLRTEAYPDPAPYRFAIRQEVVEEKADLLAHERAPVEVDRQRQ